VARTEVARVGHDGGELFELIELCGHGGAGIEKTGDDGGSARRCREDQSALNKG